MKKSNSKGLWLLAMLLMLPVWAFAQNITVKGTVTDLSGEPLPGVNVIEQGASKGVVTNLDGNYIISAQSNGTLSFSYVGYNTKSVKSTDRQQSTYSLPTTTNFLTKWWS